MRLLSGVRPGVVSAAVRGGRADEGPPLRGASGGPIGPTSWARSSRVARAGDRLSARRGGGPPSRRAPGRYRRIGSRPVDPSSARVGSGRRCEGLGNRRSRQDAGERNRGYSARRIRRPMFGSHGLRICLRKRRAKCGPSRRGSACAPNLGRSRARNRPHVRRRVTPARRVLPFALP